MSYKNKLSLFPLLLAFLTFFTATKSFADMPALQDSEMPIKINADDMLYEMDKNTVTFIKNVVVTRGDFVMKSQKMIIHLKKEKGAQDSAKEENMVSKPNQKIPLTGVVTEGSQNVEDKNSIDRIDASGGVTFHYGTQSGSSQSATYIAKNGVLTMRGNPIVREGEDNTIRGEIIKYYMYEKRSEVIGGKDKRVEAIFKN